MDTIMNPNFEYLCRVCAANTKGKNTVTECVSILNTPHLREKIEKYLYFKILENDFLPKVLCKTCFRQVEATASLSKIAKHTQNVLNDYIHSAQPKPRPENNYGQEKGSTESEFTPLALTTPRELKRAHRSNEEPSLPPPPLIHCQAKRHVEEVVLNVSIKDPLTRETQYKKISASQRRQSMVADMRFTPKSIAQRGFATSTPKESDNVVTMSSSGSGQSLAAKPSGVINFYAQNSPASGADYVVNSTTKESVKANGNHNSEKLSNQQANKRKSLKAALNTLKVRNAGQVSLLKISNRTPAKDSKKAANFLLNDVLLPDEQLPDEIIIASTKSQKQQKASQPLNLIPEVEVIPEPMKGPPTAITQDIPLGKVIKDPDLLKLILKALKWPVNERNIELQMCRLRNSKFTDIMSDPNLLQDTDLTQILGPYMVPLLLMAQTTALAAAASGSSSAVASGTSKLLEVARSSSGLEIAASIPYKLPAETSVQLVPASPPSEEPQKIGLNHRHSGQIHVKNLTADLRDQPPPKKMRKQATTKRREPLIWISDDDEEGIGQTRRTPRIGPSTSGGSAQNDSSLELMKGFSAEIDPQFLANFTAYTAPKGSTGDKTSDALMTLLERQRKSMSRGPAGSTTPRHRTTSNGKAANIAAPAPDLDDIILIENQARAAEVARNKSLAKLKEPDFSSLPSSVSISSRPFTAARESQTDIPLSTFSLPQACQVSLITRPIIKRRKTVITSSKASAESQQFDGNNQPKPASLATSSSESPSNIQGGDQRPVTKKNADSTASVRSTDEILPISKSSSSSSVGGLEGEVAAAKTSVQSIGIQVSSIVRLRKDTANPKAKAEAVEVQGTNDVKAQSTESSEETVVTTPKTEVTAADTVSKTSIDEEERVEVKDKAAVRESPAAKKSLKATLGKKLLEAIGIKSESKDPNLVTDNGGEALTPKESIQQIRSALKRSLKQAQEQSKRKSIESPVVKQHADSTTTPVVKDLPKESVVDVEEAIDKTTIVVETNAESQNGETEDEDPSKEMPPETEENVDPKLDEYSTPRPSDDSKAIDEESVDGGEEEKQGSSSSPAAGAIARTENLEKSPTEEDPLNIPKRRGRKPKILKDTEEKDVIEAFKEEKSDEIIGRESPAVRKTAARQGSRAQRENEPNEAVAANSDAVNVGSSGGSRPTRVSKTLSRYYKGPDKTATPSRTLATRASSRKRT